MTTVTPTLGAPATPIEVREHLSLPERVEFVEQDEVNEYYNETRQWWMRYAGAIIIYPGRAIYYRMVRGATREDLEIFRGIIDQVRSDRYFGWEPKTSASGTTYWVWTNAWHIDEPDTHGSPLIKCDEQSCLRSWHDGEPDLLEHTAYENESGTVTAVRWEGQVDWRVFVNGPSDDLAVPAAMSLASDLMWAAAECKKLNSI